jgi:phage antirepressor YoqD-like protein
MSSVERSETVNNTTMATSTEAQHTHGGAGVVVEVKVLVHILRRSPQTARQLAKALGVHKHDINVVLYANADVFERVNDESENVPLWDVKEDVEEELEECDRCGRETEDDDLTETSDGERVCEECMEEEEEMEDCDCGYTHHHEDKCPIGKQCEMYDKWRDDEEEEEDDEEEKEEKEEETEVVLPRAYMYDDRLDAIEYQDEQEIVRLTEKVAQMEKEVKKWTFCAWSNHTKTTDGQLALCSGCGGYAEWNGTTNSKCETCALDTEAGEVHREVIHHNCAECVAGEPQLKKKKFIKVVE